MSIFFFFAELLHLLRILTSEKPNSACIPSYSLFLPLILHLLQFSKRPHSCKTNSMWLAFFLFSLSPPLFPFLYFFFLPKDWEVPPRFCYHHHHPLPPSSSAPNLLRNLSLSVATLPFPFLFAILYASYILKETRSCWWSHRRQGPLCLPRQCHAKPSFDRSVFLNVFHFFPL